MTQPRTSEEIRDWLITRIGHYLDRPTEPVDPDASLAEYGLDSVYAFALCGAIEDTLGLSVEPTLVWEVNTVTALTAHLVGLRSDRPAA
ncbi:acyl carrier protein [Kitasatospora sp. CB01950]|uniref:acyl carrier protein n=1 Tax=Kitasatospora sp. CB01950 TaxID=1703930 RepID=UPI00093D0AE4|nr:acyl carrier protein [Kitasatospora sp. CB01950]OKI97217.1 polyketide synthase [Kitasatospora sp. CB01950]